MTRNLIDIKVAIQGFEASFHEVAARKFFHGTHVTPVFCESFPRLFEVLKSGEVDYAMMAIENTLAGSIMPNYTLLRDNKFKIIGEIYLHIVQNLMALPGTQIEDLNEVHSHPVAIAQSLAFFENYPKIKLVESSDTALSAKEISEQKIEKRGAIASKHAARIFNLDILAPSVETHKKNFTRFLTLGNAANSHIQVDNINKASLCFSLPHEEGSLASVLAILSYYKMNLTKIQSFPIMGQEFEYFFHIDIVFTSHEKYKQAIQAVTPLLHNIQILGEYRKADSIQDA